MDEHDETQHQASPGNTPGEGIRIIGADEAADALESGKASGRHSEAPAWMAEGVDPSEAIDLTQPLMPGSPSHAEAHQPSDEVRRPARSGVDRATGRTSVQGLFRRGGQARPSSGPRSGSEDAAPGDELMEDSFAMANESGRREGSGGGDDLGGWEDSWRGRSARSGGPGEGGRDDQVSGVADYGESAEDTGRFRSEPPPRPPRGARRKAPRFSPPRLRRPQNDLTTRILTGLGIGVAAVVLFKLGSVTALALVLLVVAAAAAELFGVLRRAGYRPATLVGLVATVGIVIGAYMKGEAAIPLVLALVVVFTLLWYLLGVVRARPTVNVAVTLFAFMWVGLLGSFAALLLDPRMFPNRHGVALLLGAAVATVGYDIGSFLVGGRFGRHLLAPAISPHKTWEGLVGGTVASVLVGAVVVSQISPWTTARGIALGLVVAVAAPLGDLCESLLKRDMGIKDMGAILPGHGGILDRADALLFVIPATYYLVRLINFGG